MQDFFLLLKVKFEGDVDSFAFEHFIKIQELKRNSTIPMQLPYIKFWHKRSTFIHKLNFSETSYSYIIDAKK